MGFNEYAHNFRNAYPSAAGFRSLKGDLTK